MSLHFVASLDFCCAVPNDWGRKQLLLPNGEAKGADYSFARAIAIESRGFVKGGCGFSPSEIAHNVVARARAKGTALTSEVIPEIVRPTRT
jgi:hypothetical protein